RFPTGPITVGLIVRLDVLEPAVIALGRQPFLVDELVTTVAGRRIVILHGDNTERLQQVIASGDFDYVFHGHTHRRRDQPGCPRGNPA
ncbi:MAG: hypothetical protein RMM10_13235, partial [Anaerolineae bacterium]